MKIRIKICCIQNQEEAMMAVEAGASAVGLVGHMPSGPGVIRDDIIAAVARSVPPPVATFLLTSETDARAIVEHQKKVYTNTIQMVDSLALETYQDIRKALPGVKLVQVIHVTDESSVEEALRVSSEVDALLLDSGNPGLKIKELGGTGRVHNWMISRKIRENVPIPVFLAGGLHLGNVAEAVETVQPFGIDVCSGVRKHGKLDPEKLEEFFMVFD